MPNLLGRPWAILEGVSPEHRAQRCPQLAAATGLVGTRPQRLLAHAPPALADPGPTRQALSAFGHGSHAAVPAPCAVEGRLGRAFPFPA